MTYSESEPDSSLAVNSVSVDMPLTQILVQWLKIYTSAFSFFYNCIPLNKLEDNFFSILLIESIVMQAMQV